MSAEGNINYSRKHDLTVEEVMACPTFKHCSDDEAAQVVETLKLLTKIAYDQQKNDNKK